MNELVPLLAGFSGVLDIWVLLAIFAGVLIGLVVGAMPGLGPLIGIVLLTPFAAALQPVTGMTLLIAVYVGGSSGGAVSAILLRIPGTPLAAATMLDGAPMAAKGEVGRALGLAVGASALGGLLGGLFLVALAPLLAEAALNFGPPEYFALCVLGLLSIAAVSFGSGVKGLIVGLVGFLLTSVGIDRFSGAERFTFGMDALLGGINLVPIVVGLFAVSEVLVQLGARAQTNSPITAARVSFAGLIEALGLGRTILRAGTIGTFMGALPGVGGAISSFVAYGVERTASRDTDSFGTGNPRGVIAAESANNACCGGTLVPSMALGIPGDGTSAILIGALILLGYYPGPNLFSDAPDVVGGIFAGYLLANIALLALGALLVPVLVRILRVPQSYLLPVVLLLAATGTYALQGAVFDLWVMMGFGLLGYGLRRGGFPLPPLVIGAILGPLCEENFRRSLLISGGDLGIFVERPISLAALILATGALAIIVMPTRWRARLTPSSAKGPK